jgi:hypothetical protein
VKNLLLFCLVAATLAFGQKYKGSEIPKGVSIVQLVASPEKYDGKRVMFLGVLALENEGDAVYLSHEDYSHGMPYNRVRIEPNKVVNADCGEADGKYVVIVGVFSAPGPTEDSTGRVAGISRCSLWSH